MNPVTSELTPLVDEECIFVGSVPPLDPLINSSLTILLHRLSSRIHGPVTGETIQSGRHGNQEGAGEKSK